METGGVLTAYKNALASGYADRVKPPTTVELVDSMSARPSATQRSEYAANLYRLDKLLDISV